MNIRRVTIMIDAALELLMETLAQKKRAEWKKEAYKEYAKAKVDYVWDTIDTEDFENA